MKDDERRMKDGCELLFAQHNCEHVFCMRLRSWLHDVGGSDEYDGEKVLHTGSEGLSARVVCNEMVKDHRPNKVSNCSQQAQPFPDIVDSASHAGSLDCLLCSVLLV